MTYLARWSLAAILATLAASGCYQPRAADCQLACVAGTQCPSGYTCRGDGFCHRPGDDSACAIDAAADAPTGPDASDGPGPDAGVSVEAIAAGNRHACAIRGGAMYCWGDNRSDQAGEFASPFGDRRFTTPRKVGSITDWFAVAAGLRHTCALRAGGAVYCWGDASSKQIGADISTATPAPVNGPGGTGIVGASAVCAGDAHGCAIVGGGSDILCWGSDGSGQLGDGGGSGSATAQAVAVVRPTPTVQWSALACGAAHTCAIGDGAVYCWGAAGSGRLGHTGPVTDAPSMPVSLGGATAVAAGESFSCALATGEAYCWGSYGMVSSGTPASLGLSGVAAVSAGRSSLCVTTGSVTRCLGYGGRGDLGNGSFGVAGMLAAPVTGLAGVTALASGTDFHCALAAGQVRCWGKNSDGQLGVGTTSTLFTPTLVPGDWRRVATGKYATCGIKGIDGEVHCWGQNLGRWNLPAPSPELIETPVRVPGVGAALDVAVGSNHACAIEVDGTVRCWGDTLYGRVGDGATTAGLITPTAPLSGGSPLHASRVALADHGSTAFGPSGLFAWGDNAGSWLGLPTPALIPTPQAIDASPMWTAAGLGANFGCGLRNQIALCWGQGASGQLGTGQTMPQAAPLAIAGFGFVAIAPAAFGDHVCAVAADSLDGQLYCWGDNSRSQGSATAGNSASPRRQGTASDWSAVAAGADTSCGIRGAARSLECWGANDDDSYQAGLDRTPGSVTTPTTIGTGFTAVSLGWSHGCATTGSPSFELRCWGDSRYGASGLAGHHDFATPQPVTFP